MIPIFIMLPLFGFWMRKCHRNLRTYRDWNTSAVTNMSKAFEGKPILMNPLAVGILHL